MHGGCPKFIDCQNGTSLRIGSVEHSFGLMGAYGSATLQHVCCLSLFWLHLSPKFHRNHVTQTLCARLVPAHRHGAILGFGSFLGRGCDTGEIPHLSLILFDQRYPLWLCSHVLPQLSLPHENSSSWLDTNAKCKLVSEGFCAEISGRIINSMGIMASCSPMETSVDTDMVGA